jgi:ATP-dependent Clp protease protease subunit
MKNINKINILKSKLQKVNKLDDMTDEELAELLIALSDGEDTVQTDSCVDYARREIKIVGVLDESTANKYILPIIKMNQEDDERELPEEERIPIKLYIACDGGDDRYGFALIDIIKASKTPVYGIVISHAYSMGALLPMACHYKACYPNSTFLIHDGTTGNQNSIGKFIDYFPFVIKREKLVKKYIVNHTTISKKLMNKNYTKEWWMTAEEALEYGLIDEIITKII